MVSRDTILQALSALGDREADLRRWLSDVETYGAGKPEAEEVKASILASIERTQSAAEELLALYSMARGEGDA